MEKIFVMRTKLRHLALYGTFAIAISIVTKPTLNVTGMCTLGPINEWHYVSLEETLTHLKNNARQSKSGLETQYSDAYAAVAPVDGYLEKSLFNQMYGSERFLIEAEMKWIFEGSNIDGTGYFFSPNRLMDYIPKL